MKKKEDLRILKTKASLYRGLMTLMKKKPFEEIKISEICSESLINRSTFYDHFSDKFELIKSLMDDMRSELLSSIDIADSSSNVKDYYMKLLRNLLNHIDKNIDIYSAVVKINSNSIAKDMMTDVVITSTTREIDNNFVNNSVIPTKTIVLFYASSIINIVMDNLSSGENFDKENLLFVINDLLPEQRYFQPKNKGY